jgi:hypothetical protein
MAVSIVLMFVRIILVPSHSESWGLPGRTVTNATDLVPKYTSTEVTSALGCLALFSAIYSFVTSICIHCFSDPIPPFVEWLSGVAIRNCVNAWVSFC